MFTLRADDEVELELAEAHHAEEIFALTDRNREHLRPWMPWVDGTVTAADTAAFLAFIRGEYAAGRAFHCNLRHRGVLVGGIGLNRIDRVHASKADLGYWIGAEHVGQGIVTRAARALTTAAFERLGLHRVSIRAAVENTRSRAVAERLGYAFEGVLRGHELVGGRHLDHASYAMLSADWTPGTLAG
jgi:ribosomal-protein-serine acetyltransferase